MKWKYSDSFKLEVVKDYYNSQMGVRLTAAKYGLPSKNYINNWEQYLKKKGLLPPNSNKPTKAAGRAPEEIVRADNKTEREKQYEFEIECLKARVEYLESLESLQPFVKKQNARQIRYETILKLETRYPIGVLCEIAGVSRSAYSKWKHKPLNTTSELDDIIKDIYAKSGRRFGYRKIKMRLKSEYGLMVNHKKVRRIMAEYGLRSIVRPKYRRPVTEDTLIKPNIINRDFSASKPAEKLVTDITYIPTPNKMMYLSVIIDLFDNYPVAWNLSDCPEKSLSIDTVKMLAAKSDLTGAILHSDRGVHYTNKDFIAMLARYGIKQSMSRKGNCWDNACAESFFSQYKSECIYLNKMRIKRESDVYEVTAEYFDFYINMRPQQRLDGLTPLEYRRAFVKV